MDPAQPQSLAAPTCAVRYFGPTISPARADDFLLGAHSVLWSLTGDAEGTRGYMSVSAERGTSNPEDVAFSPRKRPRLEKAFSPDRLIDAPRFGMNIDRSALKTKECGGPGGGCGWGALVVDGKDIYGGRRALRAICFAGGNTGVHRIDSWD